MNPQVTTWASSFWTSVAAQLRRFDLHLPQGHKGLWPARCRGLRGGGGYRAAAEEEESVAAPDVWVPGFGTWGLSPSTAAMSGRIVLTGHVSSPALSDQILGVSSSLLGSEWTWPIHGLRHPPEGQTNGWYIWTGDLSADEYFFKPVHQSHLVRRVPELEPLLALPPGMRFLIAPGHKDVWEDLSLLDVD